MDSSYATRKPPVALFPNTPPQPQTPTPLISLQPTRPLRLRQQHIRSNTLSILTLTLILPTPLTLSPCILTMTALPLPTVRKVFVRHEHTNKQTPQQNKSQQKQQHSQSS